MHNPIHQSLASGRWQELSICEQLGNIGSEISRALLARANGNPERMLGALYRALDLFDLTMADPRHRGPKYSGRLREICRAREVVCDFFYGDNVYKSTGESLDKYFRFFALAARNSAAPAKPPS